MMNLNKIINEEISIFVESINLNLSKQLRKYQQKKKNEFYNELESLFGKNVYRLYYDLSTGKQIYPTQKKPNINIDIPIIDKLKNDVETTLDLLGYNVVDFENNLAINRKNNQKIKITKVLSSNIDILNKYNSFLSANKKKISENDLCVVISRHSHDIGAMASKPQIKSCEDLSDFTDIKQLNFGDYDIGEGDGSGIIAALNNGAIVFYTIKHGDWNIQNPLSRFLYQRACHYVNPHEIYGNYSNDFVSFIVNWLINANVDTNLDDSLDDISFKNLSLDDLVLKYNEIKNINDFIRNAIKNKRWDFFEEKLKLDKNQYGEDVKEKIDFIDEIYNTFGLKIFKIFPLTIQEKISNIINEDINDILNNIHFTLNLSNKPIEKNKFFHDLKKLKNIGGIDKNHTIDIFRKRLISPKHTLIPEFYKIFANEKYNKAKTLLNKIPDYPVSDKNLVNLINLVYHTKNRV